MASLVDTPEVREVLALLREGGLRPAARWNHDPDAGPAMLLPEVTFGRRANLLLLLAARQAERDGDHAGAAALRLDTLRLATHFQRSADTLIGLLVGLAMEGSAIDELAAALGRGVGVAAAEVAAIHDGHDLREDLERVLHLERIVFGDWAFGKSDALNPELLGGSVAVPAIYGGFLGKPIRLHDRRHYLGWWLAQHRRLAAWCEEHHTANQHQPWLDPVALGADEMVPRSLLTPLCNLLLPTITKIYRNVADLQTRRWQLALALDLLRRRDETGRWPEETTFGTSAHAPVPFTCETTPDGARRLIAELSKEGEDGPDTSVIVVPAGRSPAK